MLNRADTRKDILKAVATLVVGVTVLGLFIVGLGGNRFWERYDHYTVRLSSVKDLTPGKPVKYAGLQVGRVRAMEVDRHRPGEIVVTIGLNEGFPVYEGTTARVSQKGLVGDNFLLLELGGEPGRILEPGSAIPADRTSDVGEVTNTIGAILADLKPRLDNISAGLERIAGPENAGRVAEITRNVAMMTGEENRRHLGEALAGLPGVVSQAQQTLSGFDAEWRKAGSEARAMLTKGGKILDDTGGKLLETLSRFDSTLESLGTELTATVARVNMVAGRMETSLAWDQERLEEILLNLEAMSEDMRYMAKSVRERPWQVLRKPEGVSR